jgi:hypothetical protein
VARAVATWNAADLEEAIIAADGAGGMARTQTAWAEHPQALAIAALPLLEIMRIGDSDPEPLPAGGRPLSNIRVPVRPTDARSSPIGVQPAHGPVLALPKIQAANALEAVDLPPLQVGRPRCGAWPSPFFSSDSATYRNRGSAPGCARRSSRRAGLPYLSASPVMAAHRACRYSANGISPNMAYY